ncbi:MAG: DNA polymerase III subunit gamma/tau [Lachnospiraceae bacterium]|nr:DNA polymerase III subunit gamma/tau [Lachnospiraceae bacterium]
MSYVALYRKARPKTFDEVKGQDHVVTTLRNQIKTGRLMHAYLFCGTRGTGKTSVAKLLARAVNCEHPENGSPCNECDTCRDILNGNSMNVIEIDAASNNGVDNIREIIDEVRYRPTKGKYKVYIIDEVHMLSSGAFNALLKTLEEPPSYVIFILATTEVAKIPVTILSRCQRFDFRRISVDTIADHMKELMEAEGVRAEDKALRFIARAADGSMRDALSLLDECTAFYMGQELTYERALAALGQVDTSVYETITKSAVRGDAGRVIRSFEKRISDGMEVSAFVSDYIWFLRNLLIAGTSSEEEAAESIDISREQLQSLMELARSVPPETCMRYIRILSDLQRDMRASTSRRVLTEVALIRMCRPQTGTKSEDLLDRIHQIETKLDDLTSGRYALPMSTLENAPAPEAYDPEPSEEEAMENAAPEDLKEVVASWRTLVGELPQGFGRTRAVLLGAHPKYDAANPEDNVLHLELDHPLAAHTVGNEEVRQKLMSIIEAHLKKHVEIQMHLKKDTKSSYRAVPAADDILNSMRGAGMQVDIASSDEDF